MLPSISLLELAEKFPVLITSEINHHALENGQIRRGSLYDAHTTLTER